MKKGLIIAILLLVGVSILTGCTNSKRTCIKSRVERKETGAWVQFIKVGEITVPVQHASREYEEEICDVWATVTPKLEALNN